MEARTMSEGPHNSPTHVPQLRSSLIKARSPVPSYQLSRCSSWSQRPSQARPSPRKTNTILIGIPSQRAHALPAPDVLARPIPGTPKMVRPRFSCRYLHGRRVADDPEGPEPAPCAQVADPTTAEEPRRAHRSPRDKKREHEAAPSARVTPSLAPRPTRPGPPHTRPCPQTGAQ